MKTSLLFLAALSLLPALAAASRPAQPNIILIISDDHGFSDYGFMGDKNVATPHLDRLARQSQLYTRGYSMPVCSPSLATLLTGLLPHQHGITGNDLASVKGPQAVKSARDPLAQRLFNNEIILPRALASAGYLTLQTGKLWNASYSEVGFSHGMTTAGSRHGDAGLTIGRESMKPIYDFIAEAQQQKKPFFVWYAPLLPHTPHNPPAALLKKYQGRGFTPAAEKYYAMVEWFDQTCGELDRHLADHQLTDNTVIIYLSDNGWDAAQAQKSQRAKLSPYELGIRTPLFVRWPGQVQPHRDDETLASIVDVVPTILKLAGVKTPANLPGLDLTDRAALAARKTIFIEAYTHDIADLAAPAKSLIAQVVLDGRYKLLLPGPAKPDKPHSSAPLTPELFDLKADPLEKNNLAASRPQDVERLRQLQQAAWNPAP